MAFTPSMWLLLLTVAFAAGFALGRVTASVRMTTQLQVGGSPAGTTKTSFVGTETVRTMELKCKCGAVVKFRDTPSPGFEAYPPGDAYTCPKCGAVTDLKQIRDLVKDVVV